MENFSAASFETIINILDSKGKLKSIHFAKDYKGYLFTIQQENVLKIWKIEPAFKLSKISEVILPFRMNFEDQRIIQFQFIDDHLLLIGGDNCSVLSIQDIHNPIQILYDEINKYSGQELILGMSCFAKGVIYHMATDDRFNTHFYLSGVSDPVISLPRVNSEDRYGRYPLVVNDLIFWICRQGVIVMDISNPKTPKILAEERIPNFFNYGFPILLANNRVAILEFGSHYGTAGISLFDISNKNAKPIGQGALKRTLISGFTPMDNTVYVTHEKIQIKAKGKKHYFSKIDLTNDTIIQFTCELPFTDHTIVWSRVENDKLAVLLDNGDMLSTNFPKSS
ncbi:hypothetical protein LEP1GSC013_1209 [Leptospira interrogans serovar Valbuzzi str. Duyster]|uniref:hypothetical protein n=1 Tax=Leptospira interrogans TaxID=173 RepID=UPI0002B9663A|nr:hypothetical protein [Leptospira interrogans]EMJ58835.1 hypothetical protein LEP1GSC013_1209 [Leptospira interrogans serovar Valbuzzi str. Duyster]ENO74213.1 hypothetical protein LEP1GSC012_3734 [Leptospira interrogans serovar Valbuzzi str. Valbuzzi]